MQNFPPNPDVENIDDNSLPDSAPSIPPVTLDFDPDDVEVFGTPADGSARGVSTSGGAVAKATAGIGALHGLRFLIGLVAQPLIAHSLGLKWQADAYAVSIDIIQRIWLLFEKVINPAFLPNFIAALKEEGEERAWRFASTTVWLVTIALLIVAPVSWLAMPALVASLSQKAGPEQIALTIQLARWLLTALFCLGLSSLTYTILNGYKRFVMAALGDALWKVGLMLGAAVAVATHAPPEKAVRLVVTGFVGGALLKLLPHLLAIGKKWRFLKPRIDLKDPLVAKMFLLSVPLVLGIAVSESRGFYLQRLADDPTIQIAASRAALKWSRLIGDNLIQVFPYAMSIGIFPYLADMARDKDKQPLTDTLIGALRVCFFVFGPISAILIAVRFPLLRAVWESGKLTQHDTWLMSAPFVAFALGLIGFACEMQLNQTFYAMTRAWTPTLVGLGTSVFWILFAQYGVRGAGWGLAAILGAESLAKTIKCIIMWFLLRPHLGVVHSAKNLIFTGQVLLGSLGAALVAHYVVHALAPHDGAGHFKIKMLLAVTVSGMVGMFGFLVLAGLLRVQEINSLRAGGRKIMAKFAR